MYKTLYRTEDDKMVGGVCGGLGAYFDIDPTLVRLLFALMFFGYGSGLMIYVFLWIIMPTEAMLEARKNRRNNDANPSNVEVVPPSDDVAEEEE